MGPSTIGGINLLPDAEKFEVYSRSIPKELINRFNLPPLDSVQIHDYLRFNFTPGKSDVEISLFHQSGFSDPVLYGHLTDTITGQIHILLYILNNPESKRYNVDQMPNGTMTRFGTFQRNIDAEKEALTANLAPGQIRHGLRLLSQAINAFENFVSSLGHDIYFVEPLYYHNAVIFERYGFAYQVGRKLMEGIEAGFKVGGSLYNKLDDSTLFRSKPASQSIRLRSWAIHDGILDEPFTNVTMYKRIGKNAGIATCPDCAW